MKRRSIARAAGLVVAALLFLRSRSPAQPDATQVIELQPGWNSVFLEVQPEPREPAAVFAGLPEVECVWAWLGWNSSVQFIQDPDEGLWGDPSWNGHFTSPAESFLSNLHAIQSSRGYLIKLGGTEPATWTVKGRPSVKKITWTQNSFNLAGFFVDPANPPTFADFFKPSKAHDGKPVYRLKSNGKWEMVGAPAATPLRSGEAYWVWCEGSSTYQGPLQMVLPMTDGIHYGTSLTRLTVTLSNLAGAARTATCTLAGEDVSLTYREYDPGSGLFIWQDIADMPPLVLEPGVPQNVWLAVRREEMKVGLSEAVLQIADDKGIRIRIPVTAERIQ